MLVSLITVAAVLFSTPAASAWEPAGGPTFNHPRGTFEQRWRIVNTVNKAIRNARWHSTVMISTYLWAGQRETSDAMLAAYHNRSVNIQVVVDRAHGDQTQARRVARVVNRDNVVDAQGRLVDDGPDDSYVAFCRASCRGPGRGINHAKWYVFTATGTAKDVVMVSSSNINKGGASKGWNDLYTIKGRPRMVRDFASVHEQMSRDRGVDQPYREFDHGGVLARFYPNNTYTDPVLADLSKVRCRGATGGAGRNGRTMINVSMFSWTGNRGVALARRLVELDRYGCDVNVIFASLGPDVKSVLWRSAKRREINLYSSRWDYNGDGRVDFRVHNKYMLINGRYGADSSSWRVHMGSQNWGADLTASDDNTLNIASRAGYSGYLRNWTYIRDRWTRRIR